MVCFRLIILIFKINFWLNILFKHMVFFSELFWSLRWVIIFILLSLNRIYVAWSIIKSLSWTIRWLDKTCDLWLHIMLYVLSFCPFWEQLFLVIWLLKFTLVYNLFPLNVCIFDFTFDRLFKVFSQIILWIT